MKATSADTTVDRSGEVGDVLGTVAAHASRNVPVAFPGQRAGEVLAAVAGRTYDTVALVAVCADGVLLGVVGPRRCGNRGSRSRPNAGTTPTCSR